MIKVILLFIFVICFSATQLSAQNLKEALESELAKQDHSMVQMDNVKEASEMNGLVRIYPNPSAAYITISFALKNRSNVKLIVFDVNGQLIAQIRDSEMTKGNYKLQWNGTDSSGNQVKNGNYKILLEAGELENWSTVVMQR